MATEIFSFPPGTAAQTIAIDNNGDFIVTEAKTDKLSRIALAGDLVQCQAELAAAQTQIAQLEAQIAQLQTDNTALQGQVAQLQQQVQDLQGQLTQLTTALVTGLTSLQNDLQVVFNDPNFVIPGATPQEQYQNLITAILNLNKGRKQGIYQNLGGKKP